MPEPKQGIVYIVGAGPGDPGLLTIKGRDALQRCGVLVYDNLVADEVIALAPPSAERIYVGKTAGRHTMPQEAINELLAQHALAGKTVVRLKGGDPFIFGRGSEECIYLNQRGVRFEVAPGVSAAAAVPAYAGIPLTSRNLSTSVHIITGHEHAFKENASVNWASLAKVDGTLVVFMGVYAIQSIADALIQHGRDPQTPAAVIRWGATPEQQTITGPLQTIAKQVEDANLRPPALIVIGDVVGLRESMQWFETRPLFGRTIAAPRSRYEEPRLIAGLRERGANVIELPTSTPSENSHDDCHAEQLLDWNTLDSYDAFLFAGPSAVSHFFQAMLSENVDARSLAGKQIIAVGASVKKALQSFGLTPDYTQDTLCLPVQVGQLLASVSLRGKRVLSPGPPLLPQNLVDSLQGHGVNLDLRLARDEGKSENPGSVSDLQSISLIAFSCASMVQRLVDDTGEAFVRELANAVPAASISPKATGELRRLGFVVAVEASHAKVESLLDAIDNHFRTN